MVAAPFLTDNERSAYVTLLKTSSDPVLSRVNGVSEITIPKPNSPSPPTEGDQGKSDPVDAWRVVAKENGQIILLKPGEVDEQAK